MIGDTWESSANPVWRVNPPRLRVATPRCRCLLLTAWWSRRKRLWP